MHRPLLNQTNVFFSSKIVPVGAYTLIPKVVGKTRLALPWERIDKKHPHYLIFMPHESAHLEAVKWKAGTINSLCTISPKSDENTERHDRFVTG